MGSGSIRLEIIYGAEVCMHDVSPCSIETLAALLLSTFSGPVKSSVMERHAYKTEYHSHQMEEGRTG